MRTYVITGGTDGMGKGLGLHFLRRGDQVIAVASSATKGGAFLREAAAIGAGERAVFLRADLSTLTGMRATLARGGGVPVGPDQEPARAPFAGRRSPVLAARLAAALGADVTADEGALLVRRVVPPVDIPVDRERLASLPGQPPADAPLVMEPTLPVAESIRRPMARSPLRTV